VSDKIQQLGQQTTKTGESDAELAAIVRAGLPKEELSKLN
jgi:hypothetical protein